MWRFGKNTGKQNSKGKRGGGRRKGRYERTVVYSKDDAATNPRWSPQHSSRGTLPCWPTILTYERPVFLEANVAGYSAIHCRLWLVPPNEPPEWITLGPPTTTSNSQRPLAKNCYRLHNRPADVGKWPRLRCNLSRSPDKERALASLQEISRFPGLRAHIHRRHCLPTWSA